MSTRLTIIGNHSLNRGNLSLTEFAELIVNQLNLNFKIPNIDFLENYYNLSYNQAAFNSNIEWEYFTDDYDDSVYIRNTWDLNFQIIGDLVYYKFDIYDTKYHAWFDIETVDIDSFGSSFEQNWAYREEWSKILLTLTEALGGDKCYIMSDMEGVNWVDGSFERAESDLNKYCLLKHTYPEAHFILKDDDFYIPYEKSNSILINRETVDFTKEFDWELEKKTTGSKWKSRLWDLELIKKTKHLESKSIESKPKKNKISKLKNIRRQKITMHRSEFLQQLLASVFVGKLPVSITKDFRKIYLLQCFVAGFRHYSGMKYLQEMQEGDLLEMMREPENEYDDCAIALHWKGHKIGFIPRETNDVLSKLLDAKALSIFAVITHLEKNTKPWENVAVAVYFVQEADHQLPAHADYLTRIEAPHYRTLQSQNNKKKSFKTLMESSNRVVNLDTIPENLEFVKEYLQRYYETHKQEHLKGGNYVLVPDDGIYEYFHHISDEIIEIVDDIGNRFLEFKIV